MTSPLPVYRALPDDRGWPLAHLIRGDGSVDPQHAGSFVAATTTPTPLVAINGVRFASVTVDVDWFHVALDPHDSAVLGVDWDVRLPFPLLPSQGPREGHVTVDIGGRPVAGRWVSLTHVRGTATFPFGRDEWETLHRPPG